ncbi:UNVERIFIED_CONTAM: hypothetical protein FKN15_023408 [Acipenser sinensis]
MLILYGIQLGKKHLLRDTNCYLPSSAKSLTSTCKNKSLYCVSDWHTCLHAYLQKRWFQLMKALGQVP